MISLDIENENGGFKIGSIPDGTPLEYMIQDEFVINLYHAQLDFLKSNERISDEQKENFKNMLDSPDTDNRVLACMIIDKFDSDEYSI